MTNEAMVKKYKIRFSLSINMARSCTRCSHKGRATSKPFNQSVLRYQNCVRIQYACCEEIYLEL